MSLIIKQCSLIRLDAKALSDLFYYIGDFESGYETLRDNGKVPARSTPWFDWRLESDLRHTACIWFHHIQTL